LQVNTWQLNIELWTIAFTCFTTTKCHRCQYTARQEDDFLSILHFDYL